MVLLRLAPASHNIVEHFSISQFIAPCMLERKALLVTLHKVFKNTDCSTNCLSLGRCVDVVSQGFEPLIERICEIDCNSREFSLSRNHCSFYRFFPRAHPSTPETMLLTSPTTLEMVSCLSLTIAAMVIASSRVVASH